MYRLIAAAVMATTLMGVLHAQKRVYDTRHINAEPPVIDGILSDAVWEEVEWEGDFIQLSPYENAPPSQQTRFRILYDENNLYIAIQAFDSAPDSIERRMSRRDGFEGDWVEVNIDSYHDLRTGFSFTLTAAGVKGDEAITNDDDWDTSWDPIWYGKTTVDSMGWNAEIQIPLTQLRFGKQEEYTWGLQVNRTFFRKGERSSWQFISPNASGWVHNFGELHGIRGIKPRKQKDLTPYAVGRFERYEKEQGNPFADGQDLFGNVGLDGKFGITNDLTLDFTINPDFGQVEADPSEVNLTTYETYFQERRPFFIEGKNITSFELTGGGGPLSQDNLFYSRRIGDQPTYYPPLQEGEYEKRPENTTILGAFKLTGKTRKGWSIGVIESVTQGEFSSVDAQGDRRKVEIEPLTNYFTGRLQKDMNESNTRLGVMFTAVNRDLSEPALSSRMHRGAYTGGIDFNHEWKDRTYYINASAAYSHLTGTEEAILRTQTSAPHFYQREDANYFKLDSSRTSFSGWGGNLQFGKAGNGKWMYTAWLSWRSPGMNLNDVGYIRRTDEIQQVAWVGFRQNEPFSIFRQFSLNFNQWWGLTFEPATRYTGGNLNSQWEFKNYWYMGTGASVEGPSISTSTLRGGPSLLMDPNMDYFGFLATDGRKKIRAFMEYSGSGRQGGTARRDNIALGIRYQVTDALYLNLAPSYMKRYDETEYVQNVSYNDEIRFIRGYIEQSQVYLTIRLNYNITPDFTIQYYAMPFISAGKYNSFKYISDPHSQDFHNRYITYRDEQVIFNPDENNYEVDETGNNMADYRFRNADFNVKDFNSNLVVRWEYLPGSTVYLVWSRQRSDYVPDGRFNMWQDTKDLYKLYPHDVLLVKFSYRFGL